MKTGRDKKIAEEIRREVSEILHFELQDRRLAGITVTGVKMTPGLQLARIYFAMPGCAERKAEAEKGLKKSTPFVRRRLAERINIKFMPQVEFFYDESLEIEAKLRDLFGRLPASKDGEM